MIAICSYSGPALSGVG